MAVWAIPARLGARAYTRACQGEQGEGSGTAGRWHRSWMARAPGGHGSRFVRGGRALQSAALGRREVGLHAGQRAARAGQAPRRARCRRLLLNGRCAAALARFRGVCLRVSGGSAWTCGGHAPCGQGTCMGLKHEFATPSPALRRKQSFLEAQQQQQPQKHLRAMLLGGRRPWAARGAAAFAHRRGAGGSGRASRLPSSAPSIMLHLQQHGRGDTEWMDSGQQGVHVCTHAPVMPGSCVLCAIKIECGQLWTIVGWASRRP